MKRMGEIKGSRFLNDYFQKKLLELQKRKVFREAKVTYMLLGHKQQKATMFIDFKFS